MGTYTNYLRLSLLLLRMGRRGGGLPPPPACPVCQRSVFPMEALMASDRTPYHKVCLKCCECARKLDVMSLNEHEKLLYCCVCYQALFQAQSEILVNDRRKMQVLPVGGRYDKNEKLSLEPDSEYRRREEAVEATRRAMVERARAVSLVVVMGVTNREVVDHT